MGANYATASAATRVPKRPCDHAAMAESIDLFVTCPRGVEYLLQAELAQLGAHKMRERPGGVACEADLKTAYATCLW